MHISGGEIGLDLGRHAVAHLDRQQVRARDALVAIGGDFARHAATWAFACFCFSRCFTCSTFAMKRACRPRQIVSTPSVAFTSNTAARPLSSARVALIVTFMPSRRGREVVDLDARADRVLAGVEVLEQQLAAGDLDVAHQHRRRVHAGVLAHEVDGAARVDGKFAAGGDSGLQGFFIAIRTRGGANL